MQTHDHKSVYMLISTPLGRITGWSFLLFWANDTTDVFLQLCILIVLSFKESQMACMFSPPDEMFGGFVSLLHDDKSMRLYWEVPRLLLL
jgi:hypothetical protein